MNASGWVLMIGAVWLVTQLTAGDALGRLGLVEREAG